MTPKQTDRLTREDVEIRLAIPADRDAIEYIASKTWDGHDYLPRVFDDWLQDRNGAFNVMTYRGQVVALSKVSKLGDGEWWLEGLRVHPDYQGRGLARIMHHYCVTQARQMGDGVVRFATSGRNEAVLKLAAETGFRLAGEYVAYEIQADPTTSFTGRQLTEDDFDALQEWLDNSAYFHDNDHSFEHRWKWQMGNDDYLRSLIVEGRVYGWSASGDDALHGVLIANPLRNADADESTILPFAFGDADTVYRSDLWKAAAVLAAQHGAERARFKMLNFPQYTTPIIEAGWQPLDSQPIVFTRPLTMVDESQVIYPENPPTMDS
jgi:GNAT superfamily N-acetyltransferase